VRIKYFKTSLGYIALTDQCPRDFKNVLFIGKSGLDPTKVEEAVFTPDQVRSLREITKADMPAVWMLAFGYEKPVAPLTPPKPEPVEEIVEENVEEPLFDPDTFDLITHIPVRRERHLVTMVKQNRTAWDIGLVIGLLIAFVCMLLGII
jgi:hypothetical protein